MKNFFALLLAVFLLVCSSACTGDTNDSELKNSGNEPINYEDESKNCFYNELTQDFRKSPKEPIPVVCSRPVKIHDLLNQTREQVEAVLGQGIDADNMGIMMGDGVAYRGGGIVVFYYDENLSQTVRISTDYFSKNQLNEKNIQAFFSTEVTPKASLKSLGGGDLVTLVFKVCSDSSEFPLAISSEGPGEFSAYVGKDLSCP